nr:MAG TPA: hypothetical protein [Caudoviricetes sp.]
MNPDTYAAVFAGIIFGTLTAAVAVCNPTEKPAQTVVVRRTVEVVDCGNIAEMQARYGADEELKYAVQRVKDDCEADRQAALLAQTWETAPTAGVVHDE